MQKLFTAIFFLFSLQALAQEAWIDFSRDYYKIPTAQDGVYRLSYTTLSASGIDVNQLDPRDIRVFHRGEEVSVHIEGQEDGQFHTTDYLEFIGKRNDGTLDERLYGDFEMMPNPYYNTHNDTTAYFLTITPGQRGKRMVVQEAPSTLLPTLESYQAEYVDIYKDQYSLGKTYTAGTRLSTYDVGQGWMGPIITRGNHRDYPLNSLGAVSPSAEGAITIGLVGRSETAHLVAISVGSSAGRLRQIGQYAFQDFEYLKIEERLLPSDFGPNGELLVRASPQGVDGAVDNISLSYIKVSYTKMVASGDFEQETFILPEGEVRLEISDTYADYVAYDISDFNHPVKTNVSRTGNNLMLSAGNAGLPSKLLVQQVPNVARVNLMEKVRFRNVLQQPADYVIISNELLRKPSPSYGDPVTAYAAYRASAAGGGFDTLTVNIQDLYHQFSYGEKTPLAIFEFLRRYSAQHQPEYLLLVGRSYGIYNTRRVSNVNYTYRDNPSVFAFQDLLPAAGYPYSDNRYAVGLNPTDPQAQTVAVGRIPARTPAEVGYYLDKVKEKDALYPLPSLSL